MSRFKRENIFNLKSEDMDNKEFLVKLGRLEEKTTSIAESVDEIKSSMKIIERFSGDIAALKIHTETIFESTNKLSANVDLLKDTNSRIKGGGQVLAVFQVVLIAAIFWVFSHVSEADSLSRLQAQKIEQLEQILNKVR